VMENVAARRGRIHVSLPAAPAFRVEKEIRNVITVVSKTSHYWVDHMPYSQQAAIRALFHELSLEGVVVPPAPDATAVEPAAAAALAHAFAARGEPAAAPSVTPGWVGVPCASVETAIWMMRALVASNVLARREETTLLVPVHPAVDPGGTIVAARVTRVQALARHAGRA
jgi:sirohydrochlorin cobaltochelatase